jgi:hypothetical protein
MITFVDLSFAPRGMHAGKVIDALQGLEGVTSVMGEHDVMFRWRTPEEFDEMVAAIHEVLADTGATYRIFTVEDSYQSKDPVPWIPPPNRANVGRHPAHPPVHATA